MSSGQTWEALGQLLTALTALTGLAYAAPGLVTLSASFRGVVLFSATPASALGLAFLLYSGVGSFAALVLGQVRRSDGSIGAALLFWIGFVALALGDALFYALQPSEALVLLIGGASAVLVTLGTLVIVQRPGGATGAPQQKP